MRSSLSALRAPASTCFPAAEAIIFSLPPLYSSRVRKRSEGAEIGLRALEHFLALAVEMTTLGQEMEEDVSPCNSDSADARMGAAGEEGVGKSD